MPFVAFPREAVVTAMTAQRWDPSREEIPLLSGEREQLYRATSGWHGTLTIAKTNDDALADEVAMFLAQMAGGEDFTSIPAFGPRGISLSFTGIPASADYEPASDDYDPGPPVVGTPQKGTAAVLSTTVTSVVGNTAIIHRFLPGMRVGKFIELGGRTVRIAGLARSNPVPAGRDETTIRWFPASVQTIAGAAITRTLWLRARQRTGSGGSQLPMSGDGEYGPWTWVWEERRT